MPNPSQLATRRREYAAGGLAETDLAATWPEQLGRWLDEAESAGVNELNAVVLATASAEGQPSARTVVSKKDKSHHPFQAQEKLSAQANR